MALQDTIRSLTCRLYPKGRAFRMPEGGVLDRVHKALAVSEVAAYGAALSIQDSMLADNPNFTADDATDWERRLGLVSNPAVLLSLRKAAIMQKLNYPGTAAPRQHFKYIEAELQAAGFSVAIWENNIGGATQTPSQFFSLAFGAVHSDDVQHGQLQHGADFNNIIANYVDEDRDATFVIGSNLRSTFFLTSIPAGSPAAFTRAQIPAARKDEFRQLLLMLKPAQTVGYLYVNYI